MSKFWLQPAAGPSLEIEADDWSVDQVGTLSFQRGEHSTLAYGHGQWIWIGQVGDEGGVIGVIGFTGKAR